MAKKSDTKQATPEVKVMSREMRTAERKRLNRERNEMQHRANLERKAKGLPTVHEAKRIARAERRKPIRKEYERKQDILQRQRLAADERAQKAKDSLAEELLRTKTAGDRKKVARATSPKASEVKVSHVAS